MPLVVPGITANTGNPTEQWTNLLLGKKLHDTQSDETNFAKKDLPSDHRVLGEGDMKTMDFKPDRLNIHTDKDGIVTKVTHG